MAIDFPNSPSPGATFTANSKTWTFTNGKWALNVSVGGVTGPAGVAIQGTAPTTTDILWVDTSDAGLVITPAGGATGQVLTKSSSADYATTWATPVTSGDMALKANLESPTFTGTPTLPTGTIATTPTALDSSTKVATTAFVTSADALKADLASPTFTGTPTLPSGTIATTQTAGNNTTAVATTAFVSTAVANLVDSAPATLNTLDELALALGDDANFATTTATAIGLKAPIASPTFTGTVTIPTGASITAPTGLVKGDVGLGNVDNTADTAKPVSTAQQTALNLKANLESPTFTGTLSVTAPVLTNGIISASGRGEFRTSPVEGGAGRGVGIGGGAGDTPAILQFTNNAFSAQWGSIVASNPNILAINALDGSAGTISLNASSITTSSPITGSIVQIKHDIFATSYSRTNTTGTPIDVTGWSMSITPAKAGNKIIILTQAALMAICDGYLYLKKNGSLLANPLISVPRVDFSYDDATFFGQYLDTAASTSAITYQFAGTATGCSGVFGVNSQGGVSSTILIEVQS